MDIAEYRQNPKRVHEHPRHIVITHVCRQWREIALEYPLLWTRVENPNSAEFALACMERSQDCALDVIFDEPLSIYKWSVDAIRAVLLKHIHQICSLTLWDMHHIDSMVPPNLEVHAAKLHTLNLGDDMSDLIYSFRTAPQLTFLDVMSSPAVFHVLSRFPTLEHLEIRRPNVHLFHPVPETHWVDHTEVLKCLQMLPRLRSLKVHCYSSAEPPSDIVGPRGVQIELPCLTALKVSGKLLDCLYILEHLTLPSLRECIFRSLSYTPRDIAALSPTFSGTISRHGNWRAVCTMSLEPYFWVCYGGGNDGVKINGYSEEITFPDWLGTHIEPRLSFPLNTFEAEALSFLCSRLFKSVSLTTWVERAMAFSGRYDF